MLSAEDIVDIEDVIPVLVVGAFVVYRLARFGQYSTRVVGRLVAELGVAKRVCLRQIGGEAFERLNDQ